MRRYHCLLATLAVLSAPALAGTTAEHANSPAATKAGPQVQSDNRKYCIEPDETTTGTRLRIPECRTKADWAKRGVDVDDLQKPQQ
jgi:hypothetical protein